MYDGGGSVASLDVEEELMVIHVHGESDARGILTWI